MRHRRRLLILLLPLSLVLPGCATEPAPGAVPEADDGDGATVLPEEIPWGLTECRHAVAYVPVRAERLQPYLPEGFRPAPAGGPLAAVQGDAYLGFEVFECEEGVGLNGTIAPMPYGSIFTSVVPPANLSDGSVSAQYLKWDVLIPDEPRRLLLEAAGLPARAGTATLSRPAGEAAPAVRGVLEMTGFGRFTIDGVARNEFGPFEGTFVEFMPSSLGGVGEWRATYTSPGGKGGPATVLLPTGSWAMRVTGSERVTGTFITGTWTFSDGRIVLPGP